MSEQTVFQLRLTVEQKERWRAAANGASLSEWIRDVCDWATSDQNPYRPGFAKALLGEDRARLSASGLQGSGAAVEAGFPEPAMPHVLDDGLGNDMNYGPLTDNFNAGTPNPGGVSWPSMLPPEDEHPVLEGPLEKVPLAPDCVNAHLHWALKQGEPCRYCKGTL